MLLLLIEKRSKSHNSILHSQEPRQECLRSHYNFNYNYIYNAANHNIQPEAHIATTPTSTKFVVCCIMLYFHMCAHMLYYYNTLCTTATTTTVLLLHKVHTISSTKIIEYNNVRDVFPTLAGNLKILDSTIQNFKTVIIYLNFLYWLKNRSYMLYFLKLTSILL